MKGIGEHYFCSARSFPRIDVDDGHLCRVTYCSSVVRGRILRPSGNRNTNT